MIDSIRYASHAKRLLSRLHNIFVLFFRQRRSVYSIVLIMINMTDDEYQ